MSEHKPFTPRRSIAVASAPPGADQLSPPSSDSSIPPAACQTDRDPIEPQHALPTSTPRAGGAVLSRRSLMNKLAVITTAAAIPTAAPALPFASQPVDDPIFAALDDYRRAEAASDAFIAVGDDIPDDLGERHWDAGHVVMRTRPITPVGLAALTSWVREQLDDCREDNSLLLEDGLCALSATIDDAVRGMSGLKAWSPAPDEAALRIDPIFAVIERHKRAYAALDKHLSYQGDLEGELPKEKRRSRCDYRDGLMIVETDDPRWIAAERHCATLYAAEDDAMIGLVRESATTLKGAAALMRYVVDQEEKGSEWPAYHVDGRVMSFDNLLHQSMADLLSSMA